MKIKYIDLDSRLFIWFRERRSAPMISHTSTTTPIDIRREKVTFRRLQREGERISDDLGHSRPSVKWYRRFLVRHRLSLQRPKRQQKIPIDEAHRLAHSFYTYLRRASTWAPRRGPMGCFTARDIFNMDESPLALFGDQTKKSINDVNTCNERTGALKTCNRPPLKSTRGSPAPVNFNSLISKNNISDLPRTSIPEIIAQLSAGKLSLVDFSQTLCMSQDNACPLWKSVRLM